MKHQATQLDLFRVNHAVYSTINDIRRANQGCGQKWFEMDHMRQFKVQVHPKVYGGKYFITSEEHTSTLFKNGRKYVVHCCDDTGWIHTISGESIHDSLQEAEESLIPYIRGSGTMRKVKV